MDSDSVILACGTGAGKVCLRAISHRTAHGVVYSALLLGTPSHGALLNTPFADALLVQENNGEGLAWGWIVLIPQWLSRDSSLHLTSLMGMVMQQKNRKTLGSNEVRKVNA